MLKVIITSCIVVFLILTFVNPILYKALNQTMELLGLENDKTIIIRPILTESAYRTNCWYEINNTSCMIHESDTQRSNYGGSQLGRIFIKLQYDMITDLEVNSTILNQYNKVILLHNEYVTQEEYNTIMNHSNVFYLYPNALYKFVTVDNNIMTLGNFTGNEKSLSQWGTVDEFNNCLFNYEIVKYDNGRGLSCYPESAMIYDVYLKLLVI